MYTDFVLGNQLKYEWESRSEICFDMCQENLIKNLNLRKQIQTNIQCMVALKF